MSFIRYVKDYMVSILIVIFSFILVCLSMKLFKLPSEIIIFICFMYIGSFCVVFLYNYFRKYKFYSNLVKNTNMIDKKYLVHETINKPEFYEGDMIYQVLCDIDKSMLESVNIYKNDIDDFRDYLEMWIHEVKIPISSLIIMFHNDKNNKYNSVIRRLDNYIDQILYYVRSNNTSYDFMFKKVNVNKLVNEVIINNKEELLSNNISIFNDTYGYVYSDSKWLLFMINQIINNSIKYKKDKDSIIKIYSENNTLCIYDNGIGIKKCDINRVFDKSFTGYNGRGNVKSTGMGLYICKRLCDRLGHKISIESCDKEYTLVKIEFGYNDYYITKE